jgi:tol-pal system protein YbgF
MAALAHTSTDIASVDAETGSDTSDTTTAAPAPVVPKSTRKVATVKLKAAVASDRSVAKLTDGQPDVAEEQQIYQTAYNFIKAKKYNDAVSALQGMLKKYPSGQFASNAHYWLGELYGLMDKNDRALIEFSAVVKIFPDSPRVSDAQLKVGLIYASQSKWSDAKMAFKKVINQYPGTASARLASEQLKQVKLAGH